MSCFIVDYRKFAPIIEGLEACGLSVPENGREPTDEQLCDCVGCLVLMYDGIKRPVHLLRLKRRLNRFGVPLITWNRDGPYHKGEKTWRLWLLKHVPYFDIYATHTTQDSRDFAPTVLYLPNAAWSSVYKLGGATLEQLRDPARYERDVSFFGRLDPRRYPEMRERSAFLGELERRLAVHGVSCSFLHAEKMPFAEQVDFIQRSRINLNYSAGADEGTEKSWGLPERCYGVQACGGFLLSDERGHAADDFRIGDEWVSFDSLDDCVAKVRHYLANFAEARRIAEAAHARVMRDHTYVNRARSLVDAALAWKERHGRSADARLARG